MEHQASGGQDPPEPPRRRRPGRPRGAAISLIVAMCAVLGGLTVASVGTALADPSSSPGPGVSPGPSASPGADPSAGPGPAGPAPTVGPFDPLTAGELDRARTIALDQATADAATDVNGERGPEVLDAELIDADDDGAAQARRAAIYYYNYRDNVLTKRVVNLTTGKVEGTFTAKDMQPPLSDREVSKAFRLLLGSDLAGEFKSEYKKATGRDYNESEQLTIIGHTYVAQPGDAKAVAECGAHRCAQLFPRIPDGPFIDITAMVVDLSSRAARQR